MQIMKVKESALDNVYTAQNNQLVRDHGRLYILEGRESLTGYGYCRSVATGKGNLLWADDELEVYVDNEEQPDADHEG